LQAFQLPEEYVGKVTVASVVGRATIAGNACRYELSLYDEHDAYDATVAVYPLLSGRGRGPDTDADRARNGGLMQFFLLPYLLDQTSKALALGFFAIVHRPPHQEEATAEFPPYAPWRPGTDLATGHLEYQATLTLSRSDTRRPFGRALDDILHHLPPLSAPLVTCILTPNQDFA